MLVPMINIGASPHIIIVKIKIVLNLTRAYTTPLLLLLLLFFLVSLHAIDIQPTNYVWHSKVFYKNYEK